MTASHIYDGEQIDTKLPLWQSFTTDTPEWFGTTAFTLSYGLVMIIIIAKSQYWKINGLNILGTVQKQLF